MSVSSFLRHIRVLVAVAVVAGFGLVRSEALPVVDVYAGYDGFYRPGAWAPVVVVVNNQPSDKDKSSGLEDFHGVLTIPSESMSDPPDGFLFTREITVPAHSIQRFYVCAKFPETPMAPVLELRTPNRRLLATYPLNIQPLLPGNVLLVTVSQEMAPIRLPPLTGVDPILRSTSPPDRLPEHWWAYESVGAVLLTRWSETYLRPAQEEALDLWLQSGGTLIILGGTDPTAWKGSLMDRVLPGKVSRSERLRLQPGDPRQGAVRISNPDEPIEPNDVVVARLEPNLDAQVLAEVDGLPLLVRSHYGRGTILFFAIDFQNTPEGVSQIFSPLWRALVPYDSMTGAHNTWRADMRSSFQIVSRRAARPPNIFLIFLLLIGYVVAVGPLNFRFLSRRKKVEWAWFTVPAIVLLFSGLIYGIGVLTKGGRLIVREASLVKGEAGERMATLDGLYGVFSPVKSHYSARPKDPHIALGESDEWSKSLHNLRRSFSAFQPVAIGRQASAGLLGFAGAKTVINLQDQTQSVADKPLGQWDLAFLETYGLVDLEGSITADLTWYGNQIAGTIKNTTSRTLKSPILAYGNLAYAFSRDLLPGDTLEIRKDAVLFPGDKTRTAWGPLQEVLSREVIEKKKFDSEEEALAAKTSQYLAHYQFFPVLSSRLFPPHAGEAWLLAFSDEPIADVQLSATPDVLTHSGCYMIRLPLRPSPGTHIVPASETRLELLTQSPDGELYFVDEGYMEMAESSCIVSATLPFDDPNVRVEGLQVAAALQVGTNQDFSLEILDQSQPRWVEIPHNELPDGGRQYVQNFRGDAPRYAAPLNGRVFLRLASKRTPNPSMSFQRHTTILTQLGVTYAIGAP